jgi:hypothetical protein
MSTERFSFYPTDPICASSKIRSRQLRRDPVWGRKDGAPLFFKEIFDDTIPLRIGPEDDAVMIGSSDIHVSCVPDLSDHPLLLEERSSPID